MSYNEDLEEGTKISKSSGAYTHVRSTCVDGIHTSQNALHTHARVALLGCDRFIMVIYIDQFHKSYTAEKCIDSTYRHKP